MEDSNKDIISKKTCGRITENRRLSHTYDTGDQISNVSDTQTITARPTKEEFIEYIKKWLAIDTQIKNYNDKLKTYREMKSKITPIIYNYMDINHLENKKINTTNGEIVFYEKKEYTPLTFSYIEETLESIIPNREHLQYIIQHLKDNRKIKTSKDIKHNSSI